MSGAAAYRLPGSPGDRVDRRVVFTAHGQVQVQRAPVVPPAAGQVLLRTHVSLISTGTELAHLYGPPWTNPGGHEMPAYPHTTGYSNASEVLEVGDGVTTWKPGDRVVSGVRHLAYPVLVPGAWAVRIPSGVSYEEATFCTLATTVLNGVRMGEPSLGEDAVVIGLGLLGQLASQYLRLAGCRRVIALDVAPRRLEIAQRAGGATHFVNPAQEDAEQAVRELTAGRGADVVYEVTGRTETYDLAFALARTHGRVVGLGSPRQPAVVDMNRVHIKALRVLGAIVSSHPAEDDRRNRWSRLANGELAMELLAAGRLNVRDLVTDRFPVDQAQRAYASLAEQRNQHLGVLLTWN